MDKTIKESIIEMLDQITDEAALIKIFTMVEFWLNEGKGH